jgi:hypothetical protein
MPLRESEPLVMLTGAMFASGLTVIAIAALLIAHFWK